MTHPLPLCVSSLQSSISLLSSSISILDTGVNDYPRLAKVLQTTRHFELLPQSALTSAQSSLLASLTPELDTLFSRIEAQLEKLARRERSLVAKCELQQGRLSSSGGSENLYEGTMGARGREEGFDGREEGEEDTVEQGREQLRLKQMRQKKERLSYAVERLTLQVRQRERQLRMSVAAQ